jgi:hypothetical protein
MIVINDSPRKFRQNDQAILQRGEFVCETLRIAHQHIVARIEVGELL